jgi:cobalt-zinc-cadmium efflux system outer membrane protein
LSKPDRLQLTEFVEQEYGPALQPPSCSDSPPSCIGHPSPDPSCPAVDGLLQLDKDTQLAAFVNDACANNPTLAQARALIEAARGRQIQAGLYPNPAVGYSGSEIGNDGRAGQQGILFAQEIVRGGKLMLSSAAAGHAREQAEARAAAQIIRVVSAVRAAYFDVLAAQRIRAAVFLSTEERPVLQMWRDTLNKNDEELRHAVQEAIDAEAKLKVRSLEYLSERAVINSKQRLKAGEGTLTDLLQAEIELEQVRILAANAENSYHAAWKRLAAVTGTPDRPKTELADRLDLTDEERSQLRTLDEIVGGSPELQTAQAGIRRAEAALSRARVEPIPNVTIEAGTQYDYGTRTQIASIGVSLPIPVFNRNEGNIMAAQAELSRAQREVDRVTLSLTERFAAAHATYHNALQQVDRYGKRLPDAEVQRILNLGGADRQKALDASPQILPRAQFALALATEGWQRGEFGYLQVLTAQRTLTQVSLDYVRALANLRQSKVVLDGYLLADGLDAPSGGGSE